MECALCSKGPGGFPGFSYSPFSGGWAKTPNQELGQCIDGYTKNYMILKKGKRIADILMEVRNAHTIYH
ncbi:hypothetical protein CON35_24805 [Bacillus cereus]|nr:hypothetical protein CON35_24805 [Bacillus cereus]